MFSWFIKTNTHLFLQKLFTSLLQLKENIAVRQSKINTSSESGK